jgi:hypothetical protein
MKKFVVTLALVASAVSSFACGTCGRPQCQASCPQRCNTCPNHYYPGQTFCTQGGGIGLNLNLFGGCGSCAPACNPCGR